MAFEPRLAVSSPRCVYPHSFKIVDGEANRISVHTDRDRGGRERAGQIAAVAVYAKATTSGAVNGLFRNQNYQIPKRVLYDSSIYIFWFACK